MKEEIKNIDLELISGGTVTITSNIDGHKMMYEVSNPSDVEYLRKEFQKNYQNRNIDCSYEEYIQLVDMGIIKKDKSVYDFAMIKIKGK